MCQVCDLTWLVFGVEPVELPATVGDSEAYEVKWPKAHNLLKRKSRLRSLMFGFEGLKVECMDCGFNTGLC